MNACWDSTRHHPLVTIALVLSLSISGVGAIEIHVSPSGNDADPGTAEAPLLTLTKARDVVRAQRQAGADAGSPVVVNLHGGTYRISQTLELTAADAGTAQAPVIWQAVVSSGEVRFVGGVTLTSWQPVDAKKILDRLTPTAREQVLQLDLKAVGVTDFGMPTPAGGQRAELIYNTQYMTLARYPNGDDWLNIKSIPQGGTLVESGIDHHYGRFGYEDPRPATWADTRDLYVHGYWVHDWRDEYHRVETLDLENKEIWPEAPLHGYGYREGARYYFLNVLEELDSPGEWFVNRDSGILYFWPPADIEEAEVSFPQLDQPMLVLTDTRHVSIRGIIFESSRDKAIIIGGGDHNEIAGCTIRNFGGSTAIEISGTQNTIRSCDVYELAGTGIYLGGGDRQTLTPANNSAINNNIHHMGRVYRTYHGAFSLHGVGNRISHCWIHHVPHQAIGYSGNDHIIEYCDFEYIAEETGDVGATYTGADWTFMGHEFRYNYFHNIHGPGNIGSFTIYPDLPCGGINLHHNIFYDVDQVFHTNSGRAMVIENNLFLRSGRGMSFGVWSDSTKFMEGGDWKMVENLHAVPFDQPPYSTRYPTLLTLAADFALGTDHILQRELPKDNLVRRNVSWGGRFLLLSVPASLEHVRVEDNLIADDDIFAGSIDGTTESKTYANGDSTIAAVLSERGNIIVEGDPGFGGLLTQDFQLAADSPAWKLGFEPIPFHEMGLYVDEYRLTLPQRSATPLITPPSHAFANELEVELTPTPVPGQPNVVVRYTLDGSAPSTTSAIYSEPIRISRNTALNAAAFYGEGAGGTRSKTVTETYEVVELAAGSVYLSDLAALEVTTYPGCWARDSNYLGGLIELGGMNYGKGLLVHPRQLEDGEMGGSVVYQLNSSLAASGFSALIGIDDSMIGFHLGSSAFIVEILRHDRWERVFESDVFHVGDPPARIDVDITGADQLRLITTDGGDGIACDHAVWGLASVH